jgi:high-affinity nickel-transport protein
MHRFMKFLFNDAGSNVRGKIAAMYALLLVFNLGAWGWALIAFHGSALLLGTALLAYGFGLRHAVDADHIAAIDNVTRKLMQEGKRPVGVGFMFSLGHSSIVVIVTVVIAATALALQHQMASIKEIGGVIGTLVSAFFLFAIALINLIVLCSVMRALTRVRRGERYVEEDFDLLLADRGLLARIFRPVFKLITRSWHMYPLGLLFGLGFDTATEIDV